MSKHDVHKFFGVLCPAPDIPIFTARIVPPDALTLAFFQLSGLIGNADDGVQAVLVRPNQFRSGLVESVDLPHGALSASRS